jgi:GrpB-like predicted nucleotidyltransferase (UPF0157 family)
VRQRDRTTTKFPVGRHFHGILVWGVIVTDLDEAIHLSEYDPQWPILFGAEVQSISLGLPADVTIEHIGSTAVPGLLAW